MYLLCCWQHSRHVLPPPKKASVHQVLEMMVKHRALYKKQQNVRVYFLVRHDDLPFKVFSRNTNAFDVLVSPRNLILEMNEISFTERRNRSSMRSKSTKARFIFQLFSILYSNTVCSSNSRTTSPIQLTAVANNRCEMQIRISSVKFSLHVYVIWYTPTDHCSWGNKKQHD